MEKEKQTSTFNEELEKDYDFKIEEGRADGGANGSISYGTMCTKIGVKNKIPVVLKEVSKKTMGCFKRITNIHFDNEKQFFKDMEKSGINLDFIVKCYGTTHIGEKEHIVMEDLSKDEFVPTTQLFEITELYKTYSNQIIRATKKLEQIKKELFETKTMVHGDLHTGNIMISLCNGDVKLIDFGSSSVIKDENMLTYDQKMYLESDLTRLSGLIKCMNKIILTHDLQK